MRKSILSAAILAAISLGGVQPALADGVTTYVEKQPNSPVALSRCSVTYSMVIDNVTVNAINRTTHQLTNLEIQVRIYDTERTLIASGKAEYNPEQALESGDTNSYTGMLQYTSSSGEPKNVWGHATCRVVKATFSGRKSWIYGKPWKERLLPLPQADSVEDTSAGGGESAAPPRGHHGMTFSVTHTWNDRVQGALLVHAAVVLQGGATASTINASAFRLTMKLANGGRKSYRSLSQPAPTYQKMNPLGNQTMTAYEVAPKDDLGAIGSITVGAHESAQVIVTFLVPDVVADPGDANNISLL